MIISKTPFRISFLGGGTDYPDYYLQNGGSVLATTFDKYCYISIRVLPPFFDHKYRIVYSKIENASKIDQIKHPAVKAALNYTKVTEGLEIHHDGDLPARSGLGSSSSFTVGLINAISSLKGEFISKRGLALASLALEQNVLKEAVGSQDQISAAYGGLNRINFTTDGSFSVVPVILSLDRRTEFESNLMLFFTGVTRLSVSIAKQKIANVKLNIKNLDMMKEMVDHGISILGNNSTPLSEFGELLHESWTRKKELAEDVSNPIIDAMYEAGIDAGATGGKLLGAGAGGFMLFYVEKEYQQGVKNKLKKYVHVPIKFERVGSSICVYQPENFNVE
jgi:D-glycero-alpha-D-manno-heptose-7-phosphate kinase